VAKWDYRTISPQLVHSDSLVLYTHPRATISIAKLFNLMISFFFFLWIFHSDLKKYKSDFHLWRWFFCWIKLILNLCLPTFFLQIIQNTMRKSHLAFLSGEPAWRQLPGLPYVAALTPLPVGFPQKHQGSAMTKEVPFVNMLYLPHAPSRPQHCASAQSLSTLKWELLWGRPRLLTDCQSPAAKVKLETAATYPRHPI